MSNRPKYTEKAPLGASHESRGPMFIGVESALLFLVVTVVSLRIYSRARLHQLACEDWLIVLASLLQVIFTGCLIYATIHWDWGRHKWDVRVRPMSSMLVEWRITIMTRMLFCYITSLVRISVCLFLRRLSPWAKMRTFINYFIGLNTTWMIAILFICIFKCGTRISEAAKPSSSVRTPGTKCMREDDRFYLNFSIQLTLDLITWVLPVSLVRKLQASTKKKLQVAGLLCLGSMCVVIAVARLPTKIAQNKSTDPSWTTIPSQLSSSFEGGIGIIAASIPAVKKLIDDVRESLPTILTRTNTGAERGPSDEEIQLQPTTKHGSYEI